MRLAPTRTASPRAATRPVVCTGILAASLAATSGAVLGCERSVATGETARPAVAATGAATGAATVDVVLPLAYPSHHPRGSFGIPMASDAHLD